MHSQTCNLQSAIFSSLWRSLCLRRRHLGIRHMGRICSRQKKRVARIVITYNLNTQRVTGTLKYLPQFCHNGGKAAALG